MSHYQNKNKFIKVFILMFLISGLTTLKAINEDILLASKGVSHCIIVAPPGSLKWENDTKKLSRWYRHSEVPEHERRLLRDSINDLALYLGQISGAEIKIVEKFPTNSKLMPIYVGSEAKQLFGKINQSVLGKFAFRVVVTQNKIGLYGRSKVATTYAIYELLHRLGCRWYMPSDMGECIPQKTTLKIQTMDFSFAPATEWRRFEPRAADLAFKRRNRVGDDLCGGTTITANHALEKYITKEQRKAHPEWCLQVNGKPHSNYLRWTRKDVADAIADNIIKKLDKAYTPSVSLSPGDYVVPVDDPEEMKHDPKPRIWEPAANKWSVTDRLIILANRVAERVGKKYPEVMFGLLAYVNYSMPPSEHKVHPNVIPVIAPIDFNRAHPMTWKNHPNETWLLDMVKGWGKAANKIGYYAYGMNLAETSAPNPFITKWSTNIPIILKNNCKFWMPEIMAGFETTLPALYFSTRITFDPKEKSNEILDEMMKRFYGSAAKPMKKYWYDIDRAWIDSREYAGSAFSYLRIFTPEVMKNARDSLNKALSKCKKSSIEYERIQLINESFSLFEQFMKMRNDFADGRLINLTNDLNKWREKVIELRKRYKKQYSFQNYTLEYVNSQFGRPYEDASRMEKEFNRISPVILNWKYRQDKDKKGEDSGWTKTDFNDNDWKTTHVVRDTWSHLGFHNYMGTIVYRTTVKLDSLPRGKNVFLWIGCTDGSAKVFINGKHITYKVKKDSRRHKKGDILDAFSGCWSPASFDITSALVKGENQITIIAERTWLNELGTGGLMGPVAIFSKNK